MKSVFYASIAIAVSLFVLAFCHATALVTVPSWVFLVFCIYFVTVYFYSMANVDQLAKQNQEVINRLKSLDTRMHHLHKKDEVIQMFTKAMTRSYAKDKSKERKLPEEKVMDMNNLMKELNGDKKNKAL